MVKLQNTKGREKKFKATREKRQMFYKRTRIKLTEYTIEDRKMTDILSLKYQPKVAINLELYAGLKYHSEGKVK